MKNFNDYLSQVNEKSFKDYPFQLYHSKGGMRTAKGFKTQAEALKYALDEKIDQFDIFKNGQGFHSTTQDEFLVLWADKDDNGYFANRSKKEPELLSKRYEFKNESASNGEMIEIYYVEDANKRAVGIYKDLETAEKMEAKSKGKKHIINVNRKDYNSGKINASNAKYHLKKNESGELVPVQAGEVIKLQKPAQETFTNNTLNNDGVEIADCTVCGATGVLVKDHICKTVIEPMAQVDSEYNMVETLITKERFSSLRAKYGMNENKMVTKIGWLKAILESPNDNSKRSEDSKSDIRMTPEEIATEVQRLFDRYNSEDLMTDIQNMFPDFNTTEAEDATNHVLDTIYDSETITDQKWLSIKPDLFTKFKHFFETTTLG